MSTSRTIATTLSVVALALAAGAPTALAVPDASSREGTSSQPVAPGVDLRMPDTRDAANGYAPRPEPAPARVDLRSPDTRDVANGYAPSVVSVPVESSSSSGFDWLSAAIGAAAIGGLLLLLIAFRPTHLGGRGRSRPARA
jgi:hypothetical protein